MSFRASRVPKRGTITLVVVLCVFGLVIHSRGSSRSALEASNEARRSLEWATTDDTSTVPELHYHDHDHSSDEIDNLIAHPPPRSSQPQPINPPSPSSMNGYLQLTPRSSFPTTNILLPVAGYTMFDRLFLKGGTLYVVVDDPRDPNIPQLKRMTSTAIVPTANNLVERIPTDKEMRVINVDEAQKILGESAIVIDGFSVSQTSAFRRSWRREGEVAVSRGTRGRDANQGRGEREGRFKLTLSSLFGLTLPIPFLSALLDPLAAMIDLPQRSRRNLHEPRTFLVYLHRLLSSLSSKLTSCLLPPRFPFILQQYYHYWSASLLSLHTQLLRSI